MVDWSTITPPLHEARIFTKIPKTITIMMYC